MALTQAYVNEVLNHLPSTVVVDEPTWPELVRLLKFEGRDLTTLVIGQMRLRQARGGYDGLQADLAGLLAENAQLRAQVDALTTQVESLTKQLDEATTPSPEPVHG